MDSPAPIYANSPAGADHPLAQGEFISDLIYAHVELRSLEVPPFRLEIRKHPIAVTLSQGCDLAQDFLARRGEVRPDKILPSVLLGEVNIATEFRSALPKDSKIWDRVKQNNDERYHFFQDVTKDVDALGEGLGELGVDFKRFFTIPTDELYHRIRTGEAKRRCRLESPYLEHFCTRFANYLGRVALPVPHLSA